MATNVAIDAILTALVAQVGTLVPSLPTDALTTDQPVRAVQKYIGAEFKDPEAFRRGLAGRSPGVRVRFAGSRRIRRTVGHRVDRVESTFGIVVASNSHMAPGGRDGVITAVEKVRSIVAARHFDLQISGMKYEKIDTLQDDEQMLVFVLLFSTRHYADYTIDPGSDTMQTVSGVIADASTTRSAIVHAPTLAAMGTPGTTSRSYALIGTDANDLSTLLGDVAVIGTSAATLNGTDFVRLSWAAVPGIAIYEVVRTASAGTPSTTGVIGSTSALTFDDTGLTPSTDVPIDPVSEDVEATFA